MFTFKFSKINQIIIITKEKKYYIKPKILQFINMADSVRKFFTKSLKSAATNCTNGQLNNNAVANRTNHLNLTTKNVQKKAKLKMDQNFKNFNPRTVSHKTTNTNIKKKSNVLPFPKPLYNPNLTTYTDNSKLKEMLFKGTDVSPYNSPGGFKKTTSYEKRKNEHIANLIEKESLKKLQYDLLMNRNFAFINFQPSTPNVEDEFKFKGDDFILNKLEFIVSQLKAMDNPVLKRKPELKLSDEFLLYTKGIDNTGGCHTLGLNLPVNEDDPYKQLSFKNRYGSTLPIELIQLKNHLPEISIGCYSMQYMGYDKDWYDLAKKLLVDVKLRSEIMSKFDSLKYRTLENENNDDSKK